MTQPALSVQIGEQIRAKHASVIRLSGPAIDAKTGVTLGGAEVTAAGTWKAAKSESLDVRNGQLAITMPPASAAIVQIA